MNMTEIENLNKCLALTQGLPSINSEMPTLQNNMIAVSYVNASISNSEMKNVYMYQQSVLNNQLQLNHIDSKLYYSVENDDQLKLNENYNLASAAQLKTKLKPIKHSQASYKPY